MLLQILVLALHGAFAQVEQYTTEHNVDIQHLALHENTLFIGATNRLYQLNAQSLEQQVSVQTGPLLDSIYCNYNGRDCITPRRTLLAIDEDDNVGSSSRDARADNNRNETRTMMDNVNKVLLVHHDVLLTCGSLRQGVCQLRPLDNIGSIVSSRTSVQYAVAANSPNASTVAFVANYNDKDTLYVAATYTQETYRESVPAVSARTLDERTPLRLVDPGDVSGQSAVMLASRYRDSYRITYVAGFQYERFAFFVSVQPTALHSSEYGTRLLRVCTGDKRFESYAEIPLECIGPDNTRYNVLTAARLTKLGARLDSSTTQHLIGVFARGEPGELDANTGAICIFDMRDILQAFTNSIKRCQNGHGTWNLPHLNMDQQCYKINALFASSPSADSECMFGNVGGSVPTTKAAVMTSTDALLTAVVADTVNDVTVLHVGTADGRIKKVLLTARHEGVEYGDVQLSRQRRAINSDLLLANRHIYAASGKQLYKIPTADCSKHTTCSTCLQSADPYCGWCTLQNECTSKAACQYSAAFIASTTISTADSQCPRLLRALSPANASVMADSDESVEISIDNLPPPPSNGFYQCAFSLDNTAPRARAVFTAAHTLKCPLPPARSRPTVAHGSDHTIVPLRVYFSLTERIIFEEPFTFYDCSAQQLCTACVRSRWPCHWCLLDNRCVHTAQHCNNQVATAANTTSTFADTHCPRIDNDALQSQHGILIAEQQPSPLRLPVVNLDALLQQESALTSTTLRCVLRVIDNTTGQELREQPTSAVLMQSGIVQCASKVYTYDGDLATQMAYVYLMAGGHVIDRTSVTLYKCAHLARDCSKCGTLDERYNCAWCLGGCRYKPTFCAQQQQPSTCPPPEITSVEPQHGVIDGGTRVTIIGRDLGSSREQVEKSVYIAGVRCNVIDYETSVKIVCITGATSETLVGPVKVLLDNERHATSTQHYRYVDPRIVAITPSKGPAAGGTLLRISGQDLDVATVPRVYISNIECVVDADAYIPRADTIECRTSPAPVAPWVGPIIRVVLDKAERTLAVPFTYVADPSIESVQPLTATQSGGRILHVRGTNLDAVVEPRIYLIDPAAVRRDGATDQQTLPPLASKLGSCEAKNSSYMRCESPVLLPLYTTTRRRKRSLQDYAQWPIGFLMDGVLAVRNLGTDMSMTILPDPQLNCFDDDKLLYAADDTPLTIHGTNLDAVYTISEVRVHIADTPCAVIALSSTQLQCRPPQTRPDAEKLPVTVTFGANIKHELGRLLYATDAYDVIEYKRRREENVFTTPTMLSIMVVGCCVLLLVVLITVAIWWRRKSTLAEKEYKRIQLQMDHLEASVRHECKQAFAELQTDMGALTDDVLNNAQVPYRQRRCYAARMLFKDEQQQMLLLDCEHAALQAKQYSNHIHVALAQFETLLWSRPFLMATIEAWESQSTFCAQNRAYVASLLSACLCRNMSFYTDIMTAQLDRLIEKAIRKRTTPPCLILRRTDGIGEKLLANWLALCLYDHVVDENGPTKSIGHALYTLHAAIKALTERGPVDAVTGDARYSLSEEKLLKETVDAEPLLLHVIPTIDVRYCNDTFAVRVLSCDTITQAKQKCIDVVYKGQRAPRRPSVYDVDLELRTPHATQILSDDDRSELTSKEQYRKLNTLAYYKVHSNAVVALVPRQRGSLTYQSAASQTYSSMTSSTQLIYPNGHHSPASDNSAQGNYFHLVPPTGNMSPVPERTTVVGTLGRRLRGNGSQQNNTTANYGCYTATLSRSIPEIYLTRLLTAKGTVQPFVDEIFASLASVEHVPPPIKYLFDALDMHARRHAPIADGGDVAIDADTVSLAWKNNALALRLYASLIQHPDLVLDIERSVTVDASLATVAQALTDLCSRNNDRHAAVLTHEAPSNRLLFAKDVPRYRQQLQHYYKCVSRAPALHRHQLDEHMARLSKHYAAEFNVLSCVRELLGYVVKYEASIMQALQRRGDDGCRLADRLSSVFAAIAGDVDRTYTPPENGAMMDSSQEEENIYAVVT